MSEVVRLKKELDEYKTALQTEKDVSGGLQELLKDMLKGASSSVENLELSVRLAEMTAERNSALNQLVYANTSLRLCREENAMLIQGSH